MLANKPLVRGWCNRASLLSSTALESFLGTSTGAGLLLMSFSFLGIQRMVGQQRNVEDVCGCGRERVWKKRKMPLSMGPLAHTLTFQFLPVLDCFEILQIPRRAQSKLHHFCWCTIQSPGKPLFGQKKVWSFWRLLSLNIGRKVGSFAACLLHQHLGSLAMNLRKVCQNWHYPSLLEPRRLDNTLKTDWWKSESSSSQANACWPEAPRACVCVHVRVHGWALFFFKTFGVSFLDTSDVPFSHPQIVRRLPSKVTYCLQWNLTGSDGTSCCKIF